MAKGKAEEYLKRPYARVVIPDRETGTFSAIIREFPGCVAQGDSVEEAYEQLERVAHSWIVAALDLGQEIPEPDAEQAFSGKIALRLPKSLHRRASEAANKESVSLNQFLVSVIAEAVGTVKTMEYATNHIRDMQVATASRNIHVLTVRPAFAFSASQTSAQGAFRIDKPSRAIAITENVVGDLEFSALN